MTAVAGQVDHAVGSGAVGAIPPAFVGRARELTVMGAALDQIRTGQGRLLLVTGEPGIGKSALVDAFASEAAQRGARVVWGTAWEDSGAPAYWPWVQVLRALAPGLPRDAGAARDLSPLGKLVPEFAGDAAAPSGEGERFALFDAVAGALELAAGPDPLVVIIEDLHAAGVPSALLLRFVARHCRDAPVMLVATYRDVEARLAAGLGDIVAEMEATGTVVSPAALAEPEVREVVSAVAPGVGDEIVAAIMARTQGNPLFVTQVARLVEQRDPAEVPIPPGIRQAVRGRLDRLADASDPAREALTVSAVLGGDIDVDEVAAVLEVPAVEVLHALAPAVRAGLLLERRPGRHRFAHALVREAIYGDLDSADRAALHHRVGTVLARRGAANARVAHHLLAAVPVGGAEEAVRRAALAGREAMAALAYEEAAELFRHAAAALHHTEGERTAQRCALLLSVADALIKAADVGRAQPVVAQAAEHARRCGDGDLLARSALLRSKHLMYHVVDHEAIALLGEAARALAGAVSPTLVQVLSQLAFAVQHIDPGRMVETADRAVAIARRLDDPATLAAAISGRLHSRWGRQDPAEALSEAGELLRVAQRSGDAELVATALTWRFHYSLVLTDLPAARAAAAELRTLAETSRQPFLQLVAATRAATLAMVAGQFDDAMELAEQAWRIGTRAQVPDADGFHWGQLFGCWVIGTLSPDRERRMMRLLDQMVAHSATQAWHSSAEVLVELARDNRDQATARFESLVAGSGAGSGSGSGSGSVEHGALYQCTMAVLAEGCIRLEARAHAQRLYDALVPYADHLITGSGVFCLGSGHHYLAGLAALAGKLDDADRHYRAAIEQHRRAGAAALLARSEREYDRFRREGGAPASTAVSEPANASHAEFRRTGQVWHIRWKGLSLSVPDSKGMRDLAVLVAAPGREVSVLDLVEASGGPKAVEAGGHAGERLDATARAAYRHRLADLAEDLAEAEANADAGRMETLRREREFLAAELAGALGLGGRARLEGDPVERARKAVTMRLRTALKRIGQASPELAHHLERSLTTGRMCSYRPEHLVRWHVHTAS